MIQKTYINGNADTLKSAIEYTELFDTVTVDNTGATPVIKCYDAEENLLFEICAKSTSGYPMIKAYLSSSEYIEGKLSRDCTYAYAYKGAVIMAFYYGGYYYNVLLCKCSNDGVCAVFSYDSESTSLQSLCSFYCVAWGDTSPVTPLPGAGYSYSVDNNQKQTGLMVFPTNSAANHSTNAFFMVYSTMYNETEREFVLNGNNYFTNGYWAIKDIAE